MTSYHPSSPQATDNPSQSQADLLDNFSSINNQYLVNHVALTAGGNNGLHTQVWFNDVLATDPNLTQPQSALYTKNISGTNELFYQNTDTFTGVDQLTNLIVANGVITGASQHNPGIITSPNHGLSTSNTVTIYNVYGMYQLNQNTYTVTVIDANTFSIGVDTSGYAAYVGGGVWTSSSVTKYGFVTPWGMTFNMGIGNCSSPGGTLNYFAVPFTVGTIFTAQMTTIGSTISSGTITAITANSITLSSSASTAYYFVIGI